MTLLDSGCSSLAGSGLLVRRLFRPLLHPAGVDHLQADVSALRRRQPGSAAAAGVQVKAGPFGLYRPWDPILGIPGVGVLDPKVPFYRGGE